MTMVLDFDPGCFFQLLRLFPNWLMWTWEVEFIDISVSSGDLMSGLRVRLDVPYFNQLRNIICKCLSLVHQPTSYQSSYLSFRLDCHKIIDLCNFLVDPFYVGAYVVKVIFGRNLQRNVLFVRRSMNFSYHNMN